MSMGKPGGVSADHEESVIVVRKRAALQERQEIQWENEQRIAAERARIRAEEEERRRKQRKHWVIMCNFSGSSALDWYV